MIPDNDPNLRTSEPQNLTPPVRSRLRQASLYVATTAGLVLFVLLSLKLAPPVRAQGTPTPTPSCTPTPTATPIQNCTLHSNDGSCASPTCTPYPYPSPTTPPVVAIPSEFQPGDGTGTVLEWRVFEPVPVPENHKGPAVLLLHEGHFASGWIFSGLLDPPVADLTRAGYYVFVAAYRQAPCGLVKGQPCHSDPNSGRPPQQTNDVKAFIRAARVDSRCDNYRLAVVGGSSGASHAAFAMFDITSSGSAWPNWNQNGDDRPLAAVCLSGAYDFTDRTTDSAYAPVPGDPIDDYRNKIENYTNTCVRFDPNGGPNQWSSSPVAHLPTAFTTQMPFRPMYFLHARFDTMPYHQLFDVQCKLAEAGVDSSQFQVLTIQNSGGHAFQYWSSGDGTMNPLTNSARIINFLDSYLK